MNPKAPSVPPDIQRPRMTPAELVQRFEARGVAITAGLDGCLCVTPADQLTAADLEVLAVHKPAILAVLAPPVAVT